MARSDVLVNRTQKYSLEVRIVELRTKCETRYDLSGHLGDLEAMAKKQSALRRVLLR